MKKLARCSWTRHGWTRHGWTRQAWIAVAGVCLAFAAQAHHSFAMFDRDQVWIWEGTVVEYQWRQPHVHIIVDVPKDAKDPRTVGTWDFESSSPNIGARQGWTRLTFKPGDTIIVVGHPMRNGTRGASLKYAKTVDGRTLYHDVDRTVTPENTPHTP